MNEYTARDSILDEANGQSINTWISHESQWGSSHSVDIGQATQHIDRGEKLYHQEYCTTTLGAPHPVCSNRLLHPRSK